MAHSVETRVPFLDNDLVDFSLQLPSQLKVSNESDFIDENDLKSKNKTFNNGNDFKKTISKYLDSKILKQKKRVLSPDASWFRGDSIDYVKKLLTSSTIFDFESVKNILDEHNSGLKNNRLLIWSLLYLKHIKVDGDLFSL